MSTSPIDMNRDPSVHRVIGRGAPGGGSDAVAPRPRLRTRDLDQGTFDANSISLLSLVEATRQFDFAIFIVDVADVATMRGAQRNIARDNFIFELGLFIGAIGAERCFMVYDRNNRPDLPTDLAGVNAVRYRVYQNGNLAGSLGAAATLIKNKIRAVGPRSTPMEVPLTSDIGSTGIALGDVIETAPEPAPSTKEIAEPSPPFYVRKMRSSDEEYILKTAKTVERLLSTDPKLGQLYKRENRRLSPRTPSEITLLLRTGARVFVDISAGGSITTSTPSLGAFALASGCSKPSRAAGWAVTCSSASQFETKTAKNQRDGSKTTTASATDSTSWSTWTTLRRLVAPFSTLQRSSDTTVLRRSNLNRSPASCHQKSDPASAATPSSNRSSPI